MGVCTFTNNLLFNNTAYYKGGGFMNTGTATYSITPTLNNNTIVQNTCTAVGSLGGGLLVNTVEDTVIGQNNIIYDNIATTAPNISGTVLFTYSCVEGGLTGTGNISADPLFVTGPEGDFYLSQIPAGQSVNSPCVDAGNPASTMIIGTTRTDQVQDAGIVDMGYHYAINVMPPPPPVTITLTPVNPPIIIPATGGSFSFNATLINNDTLPQTFDVWIMVQLPNGSWWGPALGPINLTLPAGGTITRLRTQSVPASAPPGNYLYKGRVGDYPATIWDSDNFPFTKLSGGDGRAVFDKWLNSGEIFFSWQGLTQDMIPETFALGQNYPNPFNTETNLVFDIPIGVQVELVVFDIQGREVARLLDGWKEAGSYEIVFYGEALSSGVYFAVLKAGSFQMTQKLLLLK
jgi:hypothetical protein